MPAIIPSFSVLSETNVFQLLFSAPTCDHRPKIRYPTKTRQKNLRFPVFCFRLKSGSSVLPDYLNKSALKSFVNPISIYTLHSFNPSFNTYKIKVYVLISVNFCRLFNTHPFRLTCNSKNRLSCAFLFDSEAISALHCDPKNRLSCIFLYGQK